MSLWIRSQIHILANSLRVWSQDFTHNFDNEHNYENLCDNFNQKNVI